MNIIFYGAHYWEKGAWFRKQQFASRLSDMGHTIFYIEESRSIVRYKKTEINPLFKSKIRKVNENLYVITPSAYFPFPNNYLIRKLYNFKLLFEIKNFLKNLNINDYIFWFNKLDISSVLNFIRKTKIFDLCDDLPYYQKLFGNEKGYSIQKRYLKQAFSNSNYAIVSAVRLKEKYQKYMNEEIVVAPNGHNLIIGNNDHLSLPQDVANIDGPRIGFIGTLFKFLDYDLLEYIIRERPNYNYIFVGGIEKSFPIERFKKFNNFFHLGEKSKSTINSYINSFEVCLNPFNNHEVNESVNPVKVFEYLSLNKVIISTEMYSLMKEKVANYIQFAQSKEDFLIKIDITINNKNYYNPVPKEVLMAYSWDSIFKALISELNTKSNISF